MVQRTAQVARRATGVRGAFAEIGAVAVRSAINADALSEIVTLFDQLPPNQAGLRLAPQSVRMLAGVQATTHYVRAVMSPSARVVRALLFDKNPATNWALGWHQDRTIEVAERRCVAGYGPWTVKAGRPHVAPPVDLLTRMVTVRLHIDAVDAGNAPLIVAPGSHRLGLVPESAIAAAVDACGTLPCLAAAGDAWFYATLILHASQPARRPTHRRVLQLDYSDATLPGGLVWAGDT